MFDIQALTMGELAQVEELSGQSMTALADDTAPKAKLFTAIILLAKRRTDPTFTWNQAESTPLTELTEILGGDASSEA